MEPIDLFAIVLCARRAYRLHQSHLGQAAAGDRHAARLARCLASHRLQRSRVPPACDAVVRGTLDAAGLPHLFLDGALALLLFAGSLHVDVAELNRRRWLILMLATASVILSTLVFGYGMWLTFGLIGDARAAGLVPRARRDPRSDRCGRGRKSVAAGRLPPSLRAAIVGESLFNDGAGVVLFLLALGVTQGDVIHLGHGRWSPLVARDCRRRRAWRYRRLARGASDAANQGRSLAASDLARFGARLLPPRDRGRTVGPDRRGRRWSLPRLAVAAFRHDPRHARSADRLLVAAQSDFEHDAVPADGIANSRFGHPTHGAVADRFRDPARGVSRWSALRCRWR